MKQVIARDFQKAFGQIAGQLKNGQAVQVTKHGKPLGLFIKAGVRRVKPPDFLANLKKHTYSKKTGNQAMAEFYASLS
jgi:antitoxin (DNA-binding transcriptional repressor) of toxin-antitoxin stability system